jgi:hypothetical protein
MRLENDNPIPNFLTGDHKQEARLLAPKESHLQDSSTDD